MLKMLHPLSQPFNKPDGPEEVNERDNCTGLGRLDTACTPCAHL